MGERSPSPNPSLLRATAIGLAWLGLFALIYTWGNELGAWREPPLGVLGNLDLVVGFLASLAVLALLLAPGRKLRTEN